MRSTQKKFNFLRFLCAIVIFVGAFAFLPNTFVNSEETNQPKNHDVYLPKKINGVDKIEYLIDDVPMGSTSGGGPISVNNGSQIRFFVKIQTGAFRNTNLKNVSIRSTLPSYPKLFLKILESIDKEGNMQFRDASLDEKIDYEQTYITDAITINNSAYFAISGLKIDSFETILKTDEDINLNEAVTINYTNRYGESATARYDDAKNNLIIENMPVNSVLKFNVNAKDAFSNSDIQIFDGASELSQNGFQEEYIIGVENTKTLKLTGLKKNTYSLSFDAIKGISFKYKKLNDIIDFQDADKGVTVSHGDVYLFKAEGTTSSFDITLNGNVIRPYNGVYSFVARSDSKISAGNINEAPMPVYFPETKGLTFYDVFNNKINLQTAAAKSSVSFKYVLDEAYSNSKNANFYAIPQNLFKDGAFDVISNMADVYTYKLKKPDDGIYRIENITEPFEIVVVNVQRNIYTVTLQGADGAAIDVIKNDKIKDYSETSFSVPHGEFLEFKVAAKSGFDTSDISILSINGREIKEKDDTYYTDPIRDETDLFVTNVTRIKRKIKIIGDEGAGFYPLVGMFERPDGYYMEDTEGVLNFAIKPIAGYRVVKNKSIEISVNNGKLETHDAKNNLFVLKDVTQDVEITVKNIDPNLVKIVLPKVDNVEYFSTNGKKLSLENWVKSNEEFKFTALDTATHNPVDISFMYGNMPINSSEKTSAIENTLSGGKKHKFIDREDEITRFVANDLPTYTIPPGGPYDSSVITLTQVPVTPTTNKFNTNSNNDINVSVENKVPFYMPANKAWYMPVDVKAIANANAARSEPVRFYSVRNDADPAKELNIYKYPYQNLFYVQFAHYDASNILVQDATTISVRAPGLSPQPKTDYPNTWHMMPDDYRVKWHTHGANPLVQADKRTLYTRYYDVFGKSFAGADDYLKSKWNDGGIQYFVHPGGCFFFSTEGLSRSDGSNADLNYFLLDDHINEKEGDNSRNIVTPHCVCFLNSSGDDTFDWVSQLPDGKQIYASNKRYFRPPTVRAQHWRSVSGIGIVTMPKANVTNPQNIVTNISTPISGQWIGDKKFSQTTAGNSRMSLNMDKNSHFFCFGFDIEDGYQLPNKGLTDADKIKNCIKVTQGNIDTSRESEIQGGYYYDSNGNVKPCVFVRPALKSTERTTYRTRIDGFHDGSHQSYGGEDSQFESKESKITMPLSTYGESTIEINNLEKIMYNVTLPFSNPAIKCYIPDTDNEISPIQSVWTKDNLTFDIAPSDEGYDLSNVNIADNGRGDIKSNPSNAFSKDSQGYPDSGPSTPGIDIVPVYYAVTDPQYDPNNTLKIKRLRVTLKQPQTNCFIQVDNVRRFQYNAYFSAENCKIMSLDYGTQIGGVGAEKNGLQVNWGDPVKFLIQPNEGYYLDNSTMWYVPQEIPLDKRLAETDISNLMTTATQITFYSTANPAGDPARFNTNLSNTYVPINSADPLSNVNATVYRKLDEPNFAYRLENIQTNIVTLIKNVLLYKYTVTLPYGTSGAIFQAVDDPDYGNNEYISGNNIYRDYNTSFSFKLLPQDGWDVSKAVVTSNGMPVDLVDDMYTVKNIKQNVKIGVAGITKSTLNINFTPKDGVSYRSVTDGTELPINISSPWGENYTFGVVLDSRYNKSDFIVWAVYVGANNGLDLNVQLTDIDGTGKYIITGANGDGLKQDVIIKVTGTDEAPPGDNNNPNLNTYTITLNPALVQDSAYYADRYGQTKLTDSSQGIYTKDVTVRHGEDFYFMVLATPGNDISNLGVYAKKGLGDRVRLTSVDGVYSIKAVDGDYMITLDNVIKTKQNVEFRYSDGVSLVKATGQAYPATTQIDYGDYIMFKIALDSAYSNAVPLVTCKQGDSFVTPITSTDFFGPVGAGQTGFFYKIGGPNGITENLIVEITNVSINTYAAFLTKTEGVIYKTVRNKEITDVPNPSEYPNVDPNNYNILKVEYGRSASFAVGLMDAYDQSTPKVLMDKKVLAQSGGLYTISNISGDVIITVENVAKNPKDITQGEINNIISGISMPVKNDDDLAKVVNATLSYNSLPDSEKSKVTNYQVLKDAQKSAGAYNHTAGDISIPVGLDWNIRLFVTPIFNDDKRWSTLDDGLTRRKLINLYDIHLKDVLTNKIYKLPSGQSVTVTVPVPNTTGYSNVAIVHQNDAGSIEYLDIDRNGSLATFATSSFSLFGFVGRIIPNYVANPAGVTISVLGLVDNEGQLSNLLGEGLTSNLGDLTVTPGTTESSGEPNIIEKIINSNVWIKLKNWVFTHELLAVSLILALILLIWLIIFMRRKDKRF